MTLISIDAEKCKKEGLCVELCPWVFRQADKNAVPDVAFPEGCFLCGHCVSFCPGDAITHHQMEMNNFVSIKESMNLKPEHLQNFLRMRRSVRQYKKKPVPNEIIERLLQAARYAPTGSNAQSLEHIIIQDRKTIDTLSELCIDEYRSDLQIAQDEKKLAALDPEQADQLKTFLPELELLCSQFDAGVDPIFYQAPVLLVTHADRRMTFCPVEDSTLAAYNMMLTAQSLALGTCFIGYFYPKANKSKKVRDILGVPVENDIYMAFTFGYPAVRFLRLVDRKESKVRWIGG